MKTPNFGLFLVLSAMLLVAGCAGDRDPVAGEPLQDNVIRLATTTSTENSGLLDVLLPPFLARTGYRVDVISVGTGKALALGRAGDVDVVLVHARSAEDQFVAEGHGVNRRDVMVNDFVLVGPTADPAGVRTSGSVGEALAAIARSRAPFVSRGDDSGTHKREKALWKESGMNPGGEWYLAVGQGMGATLTVADEKQAYCLTDRGTWLAHAGALELEILVSGDQALDNPYGVIPVNPAHHPEVNYVGAMALVGWMTSPAGQQLIADFKIKGQALFHPLAIPEQ